MALSTDSHKVLNNILALAPAVDMMDVLGTSPAVLARNYIVNAVAEIFKVDGGVVLHGSLLLRCTINCSILAL